MNTVRLRYLAQINPLSRVFDRLSPDDELTFLPMEAVWPGERLDVSRLRTKAAVATGYTRFQEGDVLVPKITPTFEAGRAVLIRGLRNGVGAGTTELHVLRAGPLIDPRFLLYVVNTHSFLKLGEAEMYGVAGQQRVPDDFLRDLPVPLLSLDEQRRIADFLDFETARIDRLMEKMRSQDELLSSRRRAVLAATWHPDVRVARLGYFLSLVTSGPRGWGEYVSSEGNMFFRSANLRRDSTEPKLTSVAYVEPPPSALAESIRSTVHSGDVLVGITGANTGWVCLANQDVVGANVSQHVCLLRPSRLVSGKWLAYLLSSPPVQDSLLGSQYGGTKTQLSLPDLRDLKVPIPERRKQQSVADEIQHQIIAIESERGARARQFALLIERRQALITAAVAGQLDVTTARPTHDRDL
ncbi:restriction endonuclease subunit S [Streptomyces sp. NPDC094038]|uniref:restriction endonuclease subunit S n=1 Tax=Streptomyces sp. NPDC094038 TaxID=3366055 RepID=UPI00381594AB